RGSSLADIYDSLKNKIENFQVLICFKILFEIISSGGGNVDTIESLAVTAEKIHNVEKEKRSILQPYVMIGFLLIGLTSFTTLMVIDSLSSINIQSETDEKRMQDIMEKRDKDVRTFSLSVLIQAWLAGIFLGKITTGSYSGGFQYAAILSIIAMVGIIIIQAQLFDVSNLFSSIDLA
ncbi:MAG: secretion system protein, partial [Thaumarchaeota archaeon]|nr:secretion system protein [Nitrososphaerota archaeon]